MNMIVVSYSENSCYVKGVRVIFLHHKYTMAFSSKTFLFFVVALKITGFSINFSSLFSVLLHNSGARIAIHFC